MTVEMMGWCVFQQCNNRLKYFNNAMKKNQFPTIDK